MTRSYPSRNARELAKRTQREALSNLEMSSIDIIPGTSDMSRYTFIMPDGSKNTDLANPNDPTLSIIVKKDAIEPLVIGQIEWDTKPRATKSTDAPLWVCDAWDSEKDVSIQRLDIWPRYKGKGYGTVAMKKQHQKWKQQGKRSVTLYPEAYSKAVQEQFITGIEARGKERDVPDKQHLALGRFYNKLGYNWSKKCRRKEDKEESALFTKWLI